MISLCIPLKNNLRYFKKCFESIKSNADVEHEVVVYLDEDKDNTEKFLIANKIRYTKNITGTCKGIAHGYNECMKNSSGDIVMVFHADMILGKKALSNGLKHLKEKTVVSLTRIEPPLHIEGKEKIVRNFGLWPEKNVDDGFKEAEFDFFVNENLNSTKITSGIFAPWMIYKKDIEFVGFHDELFHSYQEDSDIFNRFLLAGYKLIQPWNAFVYHLTCRGGQFQDGLTVTKDSSFHSMKQNCANNYIRKWGNWIANDEYSHPIIKNKYNIGFIIRNCNINTLMGLEPWCSTLYSDFPNLNHCIETIQSTTLYDISEKIKSINEEKCNDIVIEFDATQLNQERYNFLTIQLSEILTDSAELGELEYDIFKISVKSLKTHQSDLTVTK
jgi:glycosyltransferase involved in cell wall biosynthesis